MIKIEALNFIMIDRIMQMYKEKGYSNMQISQIRRGIEENVDISQYDDINISPDEMFNIRWKLIIEKIKKAKGSGIYEC